MNINKKIIGLIFLSFLLVSLVFSLNSINNLQKSQANNLRLFKEEFLELGRESFENSSSLFFNNLDNEIRVNKKIDKQGVLDLIKQTDATGQNVIVFDLDEKKFVPNYDNKNILSIFDETTVNALIDRYIQENALNQKTQFDLDNFTEFSASKNNDIIPKKIHFHILNDQGLIIGYAQDFLTVKIRIEFITRQNEALFRTQLYSSLIIFFSVFVVTILILILLLNKIFIKPLNNVVGVVKQITAGDLNKKVVIKTKDELGQLGLAFNEMTSKLKESQEILEAKIEERTKELQEERGSLEKKVEERTVELERLKSNLEKTVAERTATLNDKVLELERMNDLMVGREIKMAELKEELKTLKNKK